MEEISVPAIRFEQNGKVFYAAVMSVENLISRTKVDVWDPNVAEEERGYQRRVSDARARSVAEYVAKPDAVMPQGGLLNTRNDGKGPALRFIPNQGQAGPIQSGTIIIDEKALPLWVVDMQHRIEGFRRAIRTNGVESLRSFPLLVTIADGLTRMEEISQFELINTTQKKVQTDLAHNLLAVQYKRGGLQALRDAREAWKAKAAIIVQWLNENSPVFKGRIILPNTSARERQPDAVARQTTLDQSLKPVLTSPFVQAIRDETEIARLIDAYWQAIAEVWPEAVRNPESSLILKSAGTAALHRVLPQVIEICREHHYGLDKAGFLKAIQGWLHALGPDWWDSSNRNGASGYGSSAQGHALLAEELSRLLPKLDYELYE